MLALYHRVLQRLRHGTFGEYDKPLQTATVFVIDDIASMSSVMLGATEEEVQGLVGSVERLSVPYDSMFFEFPQADGSGNRIGRTGALAVRQSRDEVLEFFRNRKTDSKFDTVESAIHFPIFCLSKFGGVAQFYNAWVTVTLDAAFNHVNVIFSSEGGDTSHLEGILYYHLFSPMLVALGLLGCKNVTETDVTEEVAPSPKWCRRMRVPRTTYRMLTIRDRQRVVKDASEKRGEGVRLHFCRGHFRSYKEGEGNGLFGRKQFGTFFVPSHVRGDIELGSVVKDYRMSAPSNKSG